MSPRQRTTCRGDPPAVLVRERSDPSAATGPHHHPEIAHARANPPSSCPRTTERAHRPHRLPAAWQDGPKRAAPPATTGTTRGHVAPSKGAPGSERRVAARALCGEQRVTWGQYKGWPRHGRGTRRRELREGGVFSEICLSFPPLPFLVGPERSKGCVGTAFQHLLPTQFPRLLGDAYERPHPPKCDQGLAGDRTTSPPIAVAEDGPMAVLII